jgi:hypothetical protein
VTVPDSVSPNTNQIRANQTVLSNNTNNDNQSSTLLNIDYARLESVQQLFPGNTDVDCIGIVLLASLVALG